jgi:hypothetical protein
VRRIDTTADCHAWTMSLRDVALQLADTGERRFEPTWMTLGLVELTDRGSTERSSPWIASTPFMGIEQRH